MLPKKVLYYGKDESLPEQIPLQAGPLSLIYEAGDLRYIRLGQQEILRRVYVALRDRHWDTLPNVLSDVEMDIADDSFRITYDVRNRQQGIDFFWKGIITGDAQGIITFTIEGVAGSTFLRNRLGFCVLHPIRECTGQQCVVKKTNGTVEEGMFPHYIAPHQPFLDIQAISHEVVPGVWAEVSFTGEVFEMEDQRNWTDASYKTYCTPLALPLPVEVKAGTKISQSVTLTLKGEVPKTRVEAPDADLTFAVGESPIGSLPRIGLGVASHGQPLSQKELARLKALNLSHLRIDLNLSQSDYESDLGRAITESNALGIPLEVALHLSDHAAGELGAFIKVLKQVKPTVCTWLVFDIAGKSTPESGVANLVRKYLTSYDSEAKIGGGTNVYFTDLNRNRPPVELLDLVSYSLNPQVHAFDNTSLIETLEMQAATVESARQFIAGLPLVISPISLKPRSNPQVNRSDLAAEPGELPPSVDVRQMSLFGAVWTTGSLKYVAESNVYSVTYYETSGWRGVMETDTGSPLPDKFRSLAGAVFPLYHILADVGEFVGGQVIPTTSSNTLRVDGLAIQKDDKTRVLLANLSPEPQQIKVQNLSERVKVRYLDETSGETAMRSPEDFRVKAGETLPTSGGTLTIDLLPFAVARIDSV